MKRKLSIALILIFVLLFTSVAFSQVAKPDRTPRWDRMVNWLNNGIRNMTVYGTFTVGVDDTGYDVKFFGDTSGNYFLWDGSEDLVNVTTTRATTSGTERSVMISQTHTGDGLAILEALRVNIASAVQTGSWANAIVGRIAYSGATGDAGGGLAAAMCSEVVLPAIALPGGSYFAHDFEFEAPTTYVANTGNGFNVAFLRFGVYGNTVASFEDEAYFMHVSTDFTDASGNMWYDNTLRIQIETTDWFIPLSSAEGEYESAYLIDITNVTDASSTVTGSIQTDGGLGVALQAHVGTNLTLGYTTANENEPSLKIIADADSDDPGDTDETFTISITADATPTNSTWDFTSTQGAGYTFDKTITLATTAALQLRDATEVINSSADGQLDIDATTEVEITTATVDLNGALDVSSTITGADEVDITKSTAGMALDVNYTATSITTLVGAVDIRRTGALTGVNTETVIGLNVLPALTFTEPGAGTVNYYGGNIDLTSVAVTAGAGTSVLSALNLVAGTDGDAGANWALTTTGNADIDGAFTASTVGSDGVITALDEVSVSQTNPGTAYNGFYSTIGAANTWTGSLAGVRSTVTSSSTAAIGNMYGGRFELIQSALPASQGHTTGLYAQTTVTGSTNHPTSVMTLCLAGASGGANTPFVLFQDASTDKSTVLMSVGSAGNLVGTNSGDIYYNETLRILVNASARYIPLSTAEGSFTTAYPVITTRVDPSAAYNGIYTTVTQSATYSGSIAGVRSTLTMSSTDGIGNMYAGRFELIQSALPSSQGHTAGLYAQTTTTTSSNNPTSVLTLCLAGASGGNLTPFINILDASTTKTVTLMEIGTGNAVGTGTGGLTLYETSASVEANEITAGLRVKVNGVDYYLLMATPADIED